MEKEDTISVQWTQKYVETSYSLLNNNNKASDMKLVYLYSTSKGVSFTSALVLHQVASHYICDHGLAALKDKDVRDLSRIQFFTCKETEPALGYPILQQSDLHMGGNCNAFGGGKHQWHVGHNRTWCVRHKEKSRSKRPHTKIVLIPKED